MRSTEEWKRKRKEFLKPYSVPHDQRLKVTAIVISMASHLCVCVCVCAGADLEVSRGEGMTSLKV